MNSWPVQEAKAHFSELLNTCVTAGPQIVTRRGEETAVLISIEEWRQLQHAARPSLKSLLLSDCQTEELEIPQRGRSKRRNPPDL
ncbi:type II toxin-antitoxin system Phd/YefM family antitoxin [bacterium]|jgi:prevent-host-death family protein|nr:type II toxin-antitoxin system Phd/YefM family antitoxin [bacterium]NBX71351.1 type II toxin-antitoxin system Phd/YefM family antitoxin [bacterium]